MRQTPVINQLNLVCVDTMPKQSMPSFLRSVPTLVVNPASPPLVGDNVFRWYEKQLHEIREQRSRSQMSANTVGNQPTGPAGVGGGEPNAWLGAEMGSSFSDCYSYLNTDCTTQGQGGNDISHSFSFLNANHSISNGEFPALSSSTSGVVTSKKADELSARMEKLKAERDMFGGGNAGGMGRF